MAKEFSRHQRLDQVAETARTRSPRPKTVSPPVFMSPESLAEYLDLPVRAIYQWRYKGTGPPGIKVGKHVRFRRTEVDQWIDAQRRP